MWQKILSDTFHRRDNERVVFLADHDTAAFAREPGCDLVVARSTGGHGKEPAVDTWREVYGAAAIAALEMTGLFEHVRAKRLTPADQEKLDTWAAQVAKLVPPIVIAITHFSTSHTAFRRLLSAAGTRYGSMPGFDAALLRPDGPLDIDQPALVARTQRLVERMQGTREVRITTPQGTDLGFSTEGRAYHGDNGDLARPGSFSNLPAGEVYCAIREGTGQGRLVLAPNAAVTIEKGRVVAVEGPCELNTVFRDHPDYLRLAEFGIGTNDKASRADNILEAEKILGTIHIAFGDNFSFGGTQQIPYHVDHVQYDARILADGQGIDPRAL